MGASQELVIQLAQLVTDLQAEKAGRGREDILLKVSEDVKRMEAQVYALRPPAGD